jgi:hypothetical protein
MAGFDTGIDADLYEELWHACAGPLVTVPRVGERVFYFPQGHMEQVALRYCLEGFIRMVSFYSFVGVLDEFGAGYEF